LSGWSKTTNVDKISHVVVLKTCAIQIGQDVEVVEKRSQEYLAVTIDNLNDHFMLIENEGCNIVCDPFDKVKLLNTEC